MNFLEIVWKCLRCGFLWLQKEPPEQCPHCGGPREDFELVVED